MLHWSFQVLYPMGIHQQKHANADQRTHFLLYHPSNLLKSLYQLWLKFSKPTIDDFNPYPWSLKTNFSRSWSFWWIQWWSHGKGFFLWLVIFFSSFTKAQPKFHFQSVAVFSTMEFWTANLYRLNMTFNDSTNWQEI